MAVGNWEQKCPTIGNWLDKQCIQTTGCEVVTQSDLAEDLMTQKAV